MRHVCSGCHTAPHINLTLGHPYLRADSLTDRSCYFTADAMSAFETAPAEPSLERALLDATLGALRSEGNVLIPTDTVGRVLELLLVLDSYWCAVAPCCRAQSEKHCIPRWAVLPLCRCAVR